MLVHDFVEVLLQDIKRKLYIMRVGQAVMG